MKTWLRVFCGVLILGPVASAGDYELIRASYGEPELIAGSGQVRSGNGWQPMMEGASSPEVELSRPHMTMADARGNLFVADKESHAILKITPDGNVHTVVGTHVAGNGGDAPQPGTNVALSNPNGLYVLPEGAVYILDRDNDKIRRLDTNGVVRTVVTNTLPLLAGRGLWVSGDESTIFYTANGTVRKWTASEGVTTYAAGFGFLANIDVDPVDGTLVVTDQGAHLVYRVFPDGSREAIAGNGSGSKQGDGGAATNAGIDEVRGIAFLPHGGYFLASMGDGDIWYVDTQDVAHVFIEGGGKNDATKLPYDRVAEPRGVSIAPWGDLIITENDHGVVRIVRRQFAFTGATPAGADELELGWHSMPSQKYRVEFTDSLTATNWRALVSTVGSASNIVTTCRDTNAAPARFYRVTRP